MATVALVQARMGSTRLPGKTLAPLAGRAVLARVLDRVALASRLDAVAVVTSSLERDDPIAELARAAGVAVVRGDELDVLDRYRTAAGQLGADVVVRITADCPLVDPALVDALVAFRTGGYAAVLTGAVPAAAGLRRFPDGLDAECFTRDALEAAWREARAAYDREHVTPYLKDRPERFGVTYLEAEEDLGEERWTLDTRADLVFLDALAGALAGLGPAFGYEDVLAVLGSRPDLRALRAEF